MLETTEDGIYYFVSAGEPSGDLLAADLVESIRELRPDLTPVGIVGPCMREAGVLELAGIEDLSVMGFSDVLKQLLHIQQLEDRILAELSRLVRPVAFAVLTDYPGFHLHIAERLKKDNVKVVQYVAPQLWAWGERRTKRLKKVTDMVLGIMPFEVSFFNERGVNCIYVGTPQVDRVAAVKGQPLPLADGYDGPLLGLFPGSRKGELRRILPSMLGVAKAAIGKDPRVHVAVSVAPSINNGFLKDLLAELGYDVALDGVFSHDEGELSIHSRIRLVKGRSLQLMERVDSAIVTSGTATLECALTETPMAVMYVASGFTYAIAKRVVKLDNISLVNLVAGRAVVKEYIQEFSFGEVADHMLELMMPGEPRRQAVESLAALHPLLKGSPGKNAAGEILDFYTSLA